MAGLLISRRVASMIRMSPLDRFDALRSQMDALFNTFPLPEVAAWPLRAGAEAPAFPAMNLSETDGALFVEAELPGFAIGDVDITLLGKDLTIRGRREAEEPEGHTFLRRERAAGEFVRSVRLPVEIDPDRVSARMSNGVLTVELPKAAAAQPRKIRVSTGGAVDRPGANGGEGPAGA